MLMMPRLAPEVQSNMMVSENVLCSGTKRYLIVFSLPEKNYESKQHSKFLKTRFLGEVHICVSVLPQHKGVSYFLSTSTSTTFSISNFLLSRFYFYFSTCIFTSISTFTLLPQLLCYLFYCSISTSTSSSLFLLVLVLVHFYFFLLVLISIRP